MQVKQAGTTITASSAGTVFSTSDQSVTSSAIVTPADGFGAVNEGTVTFSVFKGSTQIGSSVTSDIVFGGSASVAFILPGNTAIGTYRIHALYNPGTDFLGSSDNSETLTVTGATTTTQPTTVTTPYSPSAQTLTLIGNVTSDSSGLVNGGTFTFTVAGFSPVTSGIVTNGTASAKFTLPAARPPQTLKITTAYSGSSSQFAASTDSTGSLTVIKATPALTWSNPANITYGTKLSGTQLTPPPTYLERSCIPRPPAQCEAPATIRPSR